MNITMTNLSQLRSAAPVKLSPAWLWGLLFVAAALPGCHTGGPEVAPDVSLVDVRVGDVKLLESSLVVVVRITNENPEPFTLAGGVHKLSLNGMSIGKGMSDAKVEVPRLSSVTQEVTLYLDNIALATRIRPLVEARRFDYRLDSRVYLQGVFGSSAASIVKEGTLDLTKARP